jgi:hypothetical protein
MLILEGMVKQCSEVIYPVLAIKLRNGLGTLVFGFGLGRRFPQIPTDPETASFTFPLISDLRSSVFVCG